MNRKTNKKDSFKIYQQAQRFDRAAFLLFSQIQANPEVALPSYTNAGISFELYLKAILNQEKGEFPNIHQLDNLFNILDSTTQHAIILRYEKELKKVDWTRIGLIEKESNVKFSKDLFWNLKELSRTIVDMRYFFDMDYSKGVSLFFIEEMRIAIASVAEQKVKVR